MRSFPKHNRRSPPKRRAGATPGQAAGKARRARDLGQQGKRARGGDTLQRVGYNPPENWYEPNEKSQDSYRVITQAPGLGYRHVVTEDEIRDRLAKLPAQFLHGLDVVQLSRMTRKKLGFPCYGMQWGTTLYLYPVESDLVERFATQPKPAQLTEARMFGGMWEQVSKTRWQLRWTEQALKDFYLNNILIHELGHLVDQRNSTYRDRERYAEWFAIEYGYKPSRRSILASAAVAKLQANSAWIGS